MKFTAYIIISAILLMTWQPSFMGGSCGKNDKEQCCKSSCKEAEPKKQSQEKKKDDNSPCNPFKLCGYCCCCFIEEKAAGLVVLFDCTTLLTNFIDDASYHFCGDCFHPPEQFC